MSYSFKKLSKASTATATISNVSFYKLFERPEPYLTFSSPNSFSLATNNATANWDGTLEYSTDKTTWATWDGTSISSASDGTNHNIFLRGTGNTYMTRVGSISRFTFPTGSNISCSGNIENLLDYATVAQGSHPAMAVYCYEELFFNCTPLISAPSLPATNLAMGCYVGMFCGCSSLAVAPALPATTLAESCYWGMFERCTSLTVAPSLPATTLQDDCYNSMFFNCTSLTVAPSLPATSLDEYCYDYMFYGCTSLTTLPALPALTMESTCYEDMFAGCTQIKLSTTQDSTYTTPYRIPTTGTGTLSQDAGDWNKDMFINTGGSFTGDPDLNTTYYTSNTVV